MRPSPGLPSSGPPRSRRSLRCPASRAPPRSASVPISSSASPRTAPDIGCLGPRRRRRCQLHRRLPWRRSASGGRSDRGALQRARQPVHPVVVRQSSASCQRALDDPPSNVIAYLGACESCSAWTQHTTNYIPHTRNARPLYCGFPPVVAHPIGRDADPNQVEVSLARPRRGSARSASGALTTAACTADRTPCC
jgi:hypothetical protein